MPTKDYRNQRTRQAKQAKARDTSLKKNFGSFATGLLIGLCVALSVHLYHLGIIAFEDTSTQKSVNNTGLESKDNVSELPPIDFQFYEMLRDFEFPQTPIKNIKRNDLPFVKLTEPTKRYILQAGTFASPKQASAQQQQIIKLGLNKVHIYAFAVSDKRYYRVWLGPYEDLAKANTEQKFLHTNNIQVLLSQYLKRFAPK